MLKYIKTIIIFYLYIIIHYNNISQYYIFYYIFYQINAASFKNNYTNTKKNTKLFWLVRACVRACVFVCVCVCACAWMYDHASKLVRAETLNLIFPHFILHSVLLLSLSSAITIHRTESRASRSVWTEISEWKDEKICFACFPACFLPLFPHIFPWLYFSAVLWSIWLLCFGFLGASGVCISISDSAVLTVNTAKVCVEKV